MASYTFNTKPPYATDEPDSAYDAQSAPQRRIRQKPDDPNARSSAYNTLVTLDGILSTVHETDWSFFLTHYKAMMITWMLMTMKNVHPALVALARDLCT
jgi:hypothetical protein